MVTVVEVFEVVNLLEVLNFHSLFQYLEFDYGIRKSKTIFCCAHTC